MKKIIYLATLVTNTLFFSNVMANEHIVKKLTVEEMRIEKAQSAMPKVFEPLNSVVDNFANKLSQLKDNKRVANLNEISLLIQDYGNQLWTKSVQTFKQLKNYDDRSLYWSRLAMSKSLRNSKVFSELSNESQNRLLWQFELYSRGKHDISFEKKTNKKILVTGFDPFFLDRNIDQSNPSGVTALALDGHVLTSSTGLTVEVEALIVPVRFEDFDQGMIEELLTPFFDKVDMIVTISMGRKNFDLERFPGLRRSANAPGNLNEFTGATKALPLKPRLKKVDLTGPEFLEFSLPVSLMQKATGNYLINDNRTITTLSKTFDAKSLDEISTEISVQGSGGGYLSNEISYRSLRLREKYNPKLPVGHIHTPRIKAFDANVSSEIVSQIEQMLMLALPAI